jgi:hypothetical protein
VLFAEWEEDEVALPYHAAYAEQGVVMTQVQFGHQSVFFRNREDEDGSCWLGRLHAF